VLHDYGIIHKDIKPENVLIGINRDGQPTARIADFGLSQLRMQRETTHGNVSEYHYGVHGRTIRYASPEHFGDQQVRKTGDCWSFATMCYNILGRGKSPYANYELADLIRMAIMCGTKPGPRPDEFQAPAEIWEMMDKCWNPNPKRRPKIKPIRDTLEKACVKGLKSDGVSR
jgi:serine/threonine protein kinase